MPTTSLNQVVTELLSKYQDANLGSEEARKKIASEIVDTLMTILEGEDQIAEFETEDITLFLSEPPIMSDDECCCGFEFPIDTDEEVSELQEDPFVTDTTEPEKTN